MRLRTLYVSEYKNLRDFTLCFESDSFIDVFVGKNGTGKSNLFEALVEIFRHINEHDRGNTECDFDYVVSYEIAGRVTEIAWRSGELYIDGKRRKTVGDTPTPENVLIYYSGHNDTVTTLVARYEVAFRRRIKHADFDEARYFVGIGRDYKELLLAVLLMQPDSSKARQFICEKLGIQATAPEVRLVLQRPAYAVGSRFDVSANNDAARYWHPEGVTKIFLDRLHGCISTATNGRVRSEGYFGADDTYVHYYDIAKIQSEFGDLSPQELFRQFDNLKTLGMLRSIAVPVVMADGTEVSAGQFSDGQFQSVYIYSVIELFRDRECVTLLDEPDSFLHPEWQFDFLQQVVDITDTATTNHVLMSSHSAVTLCSMEEQRISLLEVKDSEVHCSRRSKKEVVRQLSENALQYSEDESKLLIDNVIRSSPKPILFVEGPSDVSILNTAYRAPSRRGHASSGAGCL